MTGQSSSSDIKRGNLLPACALALLPALLYANTLGNSFQYDDTHFIVNNLYVHSLSGIGHFFVSSNLISNVPLSGYRPLTMGSFVLNYAVNGASPMGYHLVNVMIHVLNTLLVYGVSLVIMRAFEIKRNRHAAFAVALLFAVHPINTQSVNYIFGRTSLLVGCFSLACVLLYARGREAAGTSRGTIMLVGSLAVYLCALFSKEEAVAVPCLLLVYELCRHRLRIDTKKAVNVFLALLPFLILTVGFIAFVTFGLHIINDTPQPRGVWENLLTQARSVFLYLKLIAVPANLSIDHEMGTLSSILDPAAMASVIGTVAMLAGSLLFMRRAPVVPFGVWWFAFVLAPSSTLVALKLIMNEQRIYLAAIGIMFIAGAGFAVGLERAAAAKANGKRRALVCGFALVLIILAALTVHRNTQWRTPLSIWADALAKYPASLRANTQVADIYLRMERYEEALKAAKKAAVLGPDIVEARSVLASVYSEMGLQNEALVEARAAVDLKSNSSEAQTTLGTVYARLERYQEAEAAWERAIEINPQNDEAHQNLETLKSKRSKGEIPGG